MSVFENTSEMYVTKRNGKKEIISFDKILQRIKKVGKEANIQINYTSLVIKIIDQLFDGIQTDKIDEISAEQCASMASIHYDYSTLASRLIISNHHRNTSDSFSKTMKKLYAEHLLNDDFMQHVNHHAKQLDAMCDYSRDYLIDYFGFKTLERSYLLSIKRKVHERPQMMFMRLAVAMHGGDLDRIAETYTSFSFKQMIHGTPSLYNAGSKREQMSSCFARGTLVDTLTGPIPIEKMTPGQRVVTHTGEVREVTQLHVNRLGDHRSLVTVHFHATRPITVTDDHRFWIYNRVAGGADWKAVRDLGPDDYVMVPKNRHLTYVQDEINMNKLAVDTEINKFFGVWLRYGEYLYYDDSSRNSMEDRTQPQGIQIILPTACDQAVYFCWNIQKMFGNVKMERSDYDNGYTIIRYVFKEMGTDYMTWFGKDRRIPTRMFQFPTLWVRAFLSGWNITGDTLTEAQVPPEIYTLCRMHQLNHLTFVPLDYVECDEVVEYENAIYLQFVAMEAASVKADPIPSLDMDISGSEPKVQEVPEEPEEVDASGSEVPVDISGSEPKVPEVPPEPEVPVDVSGVPVDASEPVEPVDPETPVYTLGVEEDHSYSVGGVIAENCYLIAMESDSIEGIYNTLKDCAMISKYAGGIGLHIHNIRATGSYIAGTNGTSNGIVPMLRVFNNTAKYVDQCVHPQTVIYTTRGPAEIQDVMQGETAIFGMNGAAETVGNVLEHIYDGAMMVIRTDHDAGPLYITEAHPMFVLSRYDTDGLTAREIQHMLNQRRVTPEWTEARFVGVDDRVALPIPMHAQDVAEITEDDCYIYGLLVAAGSFVHPAQGDQGSNVTGANMCRLTVDKPHVYERVANYLESRCVAYQITKEGGRESEGSEESEARTFQWIRPHHLPFRWNDLYAEGHTGLGSPRLAPRWLALPMVKAQFILKGLVDAMGTIEKDVVLKHGNRMWAEAVRFLCLKMGVLTRTVPEMVGEDLLYAVHIPATIDICALLELQYDGREPPFVRHDNWLFSVVTSVEETEYRGTVYDLQMTHQHDYLLSNGLVHNGGGKRNGSIAIYLEPWHADIEIYLQMRKNHGEEELKARDLFYAIWMPDLFMKRVKENAKWTLFCPHECPGLADVHSEAFETLYAKYEDAGKGRATVNARDLWFKILDAQMETGTPYLVYKDAANRKSNQQNLGTIKSSNLCSEIIEYSDENETAVCFTGDTMVLTKEGYRRIDECNGAEVMSYFNNDTDLKADPRFVPATLIDNGEKDVYEMVCSDYKIKATANHPFVVYDNRAPSGYVWKKLTELEPDDHLVVYDSANGQSHHAVFGSYTFLGKERVYDLNVPVRHNFVAEGFVVHNCNLGSIALPAFVVLDPSGQAPPTYDFESLHRVARMLTYNLNRVIDINYYPTPKTERSNFRHRPIGIGVQGLADTFMMMGMPFGSPESRRLNQEMFETIYHAGLVESCELAKVHGPYETFPGSPASEGRLQFDLWNTEPLRSPSGGSPSYRYDWDALKADIRKHGLRNSLLMAPMPTASTSQILGYNECIEPITSNIYSRRTLAGEFIVTNKYLMRDLIALGMWNEKIKNHIIANNGSVQSMESVPAEIREKYRTVWEIPMRTLIDMAADRGVYIDQSQSLNLWMEDPTYSSLTSMHFYSWQKGLKTGIYYLRRRAKHQAQQFTIEPEKAQIDAPEEEEICEMCSS